MLEKLRGFKVAIKRLFQETSPDQFFQEYNNLINSAEDRRRNIVELLDAFRYEDEAKVVHCNLSFELAAGILKQLF